MLMSPPFDSVDVVLGSVIARLDKGDADINEVHSKQREAATKIDQLILHYDDMKNRVRVLEAHDQNIYDSHHDVSKKVEVMEAKVDDMRSNLTKVIEGQIQILNSNLATREEFGTVLAKQDNQHLEKMKRMRHIIYIGGAFLLIAINWWASRTGQKTLLESVMDFVSGNIVN